MPTTHVHNGRDLGKVVDRDKGGQTLLKDTCHRLIEKSRSVGMLMHIVIEAHIVDLAKCRLPGAHAVQECAPRLPYPWLSIEEGKSME